MRNGIAERKALDAAVQQDNDVRAETQPPEFFPHTSSAWCDPVSQNSDVARDIESGRLANPFSVFGPHVVNGQVVVRTFQPGARCVQVIASALSDASVGQASVLATLEPVSANGLFAGPVPGLALGQSYVLKIGWPAQKVDAGGNVFMYQYTEDPYAFGLLLGEPDLHLMAQGRHFSLGACLGAQAMQMDGVTGVRFAVWAPNAMRVSVVGDFNQWDGRRHPMRYRHEAGVWEIFIPRLTSGSRYGYEIIDRNGNRLPIKADPVARMTEKPPHVFSIVAEAQPFTWMDDAWMRNRARGHSAIAPLAIYEVHAASWRRFTTCDTDGCDWLALADHLIPYVVELGFTHIELLPIMEHPFGGSWGYQPLGLFAPSARYGTPEAFAAFVDRCHRAGIGVILDWVPAHFPSDAHGLVQFDGTALYEHQDPREGWHPDWNTLIYNVGRKEVSGFLISSALEWLERFHVDGLRVDAVSSMLYRDYSRAPGQWIPNKYGGRENLEAIDFLRTLNQVVAQRCPGALVIAEESTAWPGVSSSIKQGGLGFSYKWNMGWMHDSLRYMQRNPIHRRHHHHDLTFGLCYAFSELYVLAISHDEVVHGKGSLLQKMPGDGWQRLANLRAYLGFMWMHPGKKLLFMGCEFGQNREWDHDAELDWKLLDDSGHRGVQRLVKDLNHAYRRYPALHDSDCAADGFIWMIGDDQDNSVYAFLRSSINNRSASPLLVVCNFTPVPRVAYRVGVPDTGKLLRWQEVLNTDAAIYGGSNLGNLGEVTAQYEPSHGYPLSVALTLPPLSIVVFCQES